MACRMHVYYSGDVQGVGFRYTALGLARRRGVTGFVRNLSDGRVELVAEGEEEIVRAFLADVSEAMAGHISEESVTQEDPTGQYAAFRIAH